jgi:predicted glycogen debranching enzyme
MAYLTFNSEQLINLEFSLNREFLRTNGNGAYCSSSIIGCNTRKYHGLLVCPIEKFDNERFVLLSCLDETVIQHENEFNLGIHKFDGEIYAPKGHKYATEFECDLVPTTIYRVGGVILKKEILLVTGQNQVLIRYTLLEAHSDTKIRIRPFLAYRNMHELTHANMYVDTHISKNENGIESKMYPDFPAIHLQFSKAIEFIQVPDWYYNIEYSKEEGRGYDFKEDLFVPGYFELNISKGESVVFSASLNNENPKLFLTQFEGQLNKTEPSNSFFNCLKSAAKQFIIRQNGKTEIIAGYPWFGSWGRDTFIALPGLTLAFNDSQSFLEVIDTQLSKLKNGLFPNMGSDSNPAFNSVDAPLWFFWAMQQYVKICKPDPKEFWDKYGIPLNAILNGFKQGLPYNIKMHNNGLIYAGAEGKALTWMDAVVHGVAITPRIGYDVEINALWYNALMFCLDLAEKSQDKKFIKEWKDIPELIRLSYISMFWNETKGYLADYCDLDKKDFSIRPNMVIATSLDYCLLTPEMCKSILNIVTNDLLTPKGLRTLSPQDLKYKGVYDGSQEARDSAYHQGTVWPWLIEHYCTGYLKLYKHNAKSHLTKIIEAFEEDMWMHGIGTISEIYGGNPPHFPRGTISQAWSVAAILQVFKLLEEYNKEAQ